MQPFSLKHGRHSLFLEGNGSSVALRERVQEALCKWGQARDIGPYIALQKIIE